MYEFEDTVHWDMCKQMYEFEYTVHLDMCKQMYEFEDTAHWDMCVNKLWIWRYSTLRYV